MNIDSVGDSCELNRSWLQFLSSIGVMFKGMSRRPRAVNSTLQNKLELNFGYLPIENSGLSSNQQLDWYIFNINDFKYVYLSFEDDVSV